MCGRFTLRKQPDQIEARFGAKFNAGYLYKPNSDIRPTQAIPVIPNNKPDEIIWMKWGIVPRWWNGTKSGLINIRAESLRTKTVFNKMFDEQRCIIPVDGFYEWAEDEGKKIPYLFSQNEEQVFSFAGLWFKDEKGLSVAIITCEPNTLVKKIHNRMPCILNPEDEAMWLNNAFDKNLAEDVLKPNYSLILKVEKAVHL